MEIGDDLENLTNEGWKGDGLFSDLQKQPFYMVEARKSKIGTEPFKFYVCRLQGKVLEGNIRRYLTLLISCLTPHSY